MSLKLTPEPEVEWHYAIEAWMQGDPSRMARALRGGRDIPAFARDWLAAVLLGDVRRPRGRPANKREPLAQSSWKLLAKLRYEAHLSEQSNDRGGGTPSERAIAAVAEELGKSFDQVSRVVHPRGHRAKKNI